MYGIIIPYVRKNNSVHTELLFRMYGIILGFRADSVSVRFWAASVREEWGAVGAVMLGFGNGVRAGPCREQPATAPA